MIRGYIFSVEDGELVCVRRYDGKVKTFTGEEAMEILRRKDKFKYKRAKLTGKSVMLEGDKIRIFIRDEVLLDDKYASCLYNNLNRINKALVKYNKKQDSPNKKRGVKTGIATVGLLTALSLGLVANKIKDDSVVHDIKIDEIEDSLTESVNEIENNEIQQIAQEVDKMLDTENFNYQDDLLQELDNDEPQVVDIYYQNDYRQVYDEEKFNYVNDNYLDIIQERATRWGVSPDLMLSMLPQESGGYETNLMQIQFSSWQDQPITLYNFEKGRTETIVLTNNPENYQNRGNIQLISEEDLKNPKTNISIACVILRYSFDAMNHNLIAAIQAYNFGVNGMTKVLEETARKQNTTVEAILSDQNNLSFLENRDVFPYGDHLYVEHVMEYLNTPDNQIYIKYLDDDGNIQEVSVEVNKQQVGRSL